MGLTHLNIFRHKVNDSSQDKTRKDNDNRMENGSEEETKNGEEKSKSLFNQRITLSEFNAKKRVRITLKHMFVQALFSSSAGVLVFCLHLYVCLWRTQYKIDMRCASTHHQPILAPKLSLSLILILFRLFFAFFSLFAIHTFCNDWMRARSAFFSGNFR